MVSKLTALAIRDDANLFAPAQFATLFAAPNAIASLAVRGDGFGDASLDAITASPHCKLRSLSIAMTAVDVYALARFLAHDNRVEIIPGDDKQNLTQYRARQHDIYIGRWGPDYQDPHTNAETFAMNVDNKDDAKSKTLAWRNAWDIPEMTKVTQSAVLERDAAKRAATYEQLQREHQQISPFVIFAQETETPAMRADVKGLIWGPSFDDNKYWQGYKE